MNYLQFIQQKIKHDPVQRVFIDGLNKMGLRIEPFFLLIEHVSTNQTLDIKPELDSYSIEPLDSDDMPEIAKIPFRFIYLDELHKRLARGDVCIGIRHHGRIIAFTWCNLNTCQYPGHPFELKENEAYLYDIYTLEEYRGRKIGPFLRLELYRFLLERNKTLLYSISMKYNRASLRIKQKLNARIIATGTFVELFKKFHFTIRFNTLNSPAEIKRIS